MKIMKANHNQIKSATMQSAITMLTQSVTNQEGVDLLQLQERSYQLLEQIVDDHDLELFSQREVA